MKFSNLSIRTKILANFLLVTVVFCGLIFAWLLPSLGKTVMQEKQQQIQFMVKNAHSLIQHFQER